MPESLSRKDPPQPGSLHCPQMPPSSQGCQDRPAPQTQFTRGVALHPQAPRPVRPHMPAGRGAGCRGHCPAGQRSTGPSPGQCPETLPPPLQSLSLTPSPPRKSRPSGTCSPAQAAEEGLSSQPAPTEASSPALRPRHCRYPRQPFSAPSRPLSSPPHRPLPPVLMVKLLEGTTGHSVPLPHLVTTS